AQQGKLKSCGHHADHSVGFAADRDISPDDIRIASVPAAPKPFAQNGDVSRSRPIFVARKSSAQNWLGAQRVKKIPADSPALNQCRKAIAGKIEIVVPPSGSLLE